MTRIQTNGILMNMLQYASFTGDRKGRPYADVFFSFLSFSQYIFNNSRENAHFGLPPGNYFVSYGNSKKRVVTSKKMM